MRKTGITQSRLKNKIASLCGQQDRVTVKLEVWLPH